MKRSLDTIYFVTKRSRKFVFFVEKHVLSNERKGAQIEIYGIFALYNEKINRNDYGSC